MYPAIAAKRVRYEDEHWMRMALAEAVHGEGGTRPNPPVGCVIVKDGIPIVSAYHAFAGGAHAEAAAIEAAVGWDLHDATLYVTLEPSLPLLRVLRASAVPPLPPLASPPRPLRLRETPPFPPFPLSPPLPLFSASSAPLR